jgi:hypothetical protein
MQSGISKSNSVQIWVGYAQKMKRIILRTEGLGLVYQQLVQGKYELCLIQ